MVFLRVLAILIFLSALVVGGFWIGMASLVVMAVIYFIIAA